MITTFLLVAAVLLLVIVTVALGRLLLSAQAVDWVMAGQVLGTGGIAVLLLFGVASASPGVIDMALLLALLAAFATVAFAARLGLDRRRSDEPCAGAPTIQPRTIQPTVDAVDAVNAGREASRAPGSNAPGR